MQNNRKKKRNVILAVLLALLLIAGFGAAMRFIEQQSSEGEEEQIGDTGEWGDGEAEESILVFDNKEYMITDDIDTYLLIGTDAGTPDDAEVKEGFDGEMADFLVLVVINNTQKKYAFIQIDRDTITDVQVLDEKGESKGGIPEQICTAHWYGQDEEQRSANTVDAVSGLFGYLEIDGYFELNMADISAVNHAIGGVVIDFDQDLTAIDPAFKEGESILLTDQQAEKYVRARMEVGDGTNIQRMARQRQYMEKVYSLLISQLRENPNYIDELYDELHERILSDQNAKTVSNIASKFSEYESLGILRLDGESREADTLDDGVMHAEFYAETESLISTLQRITDLEESQSELEE